MKSLFVTMIIGLMIISVRGQEATEETRITINPETGDTTFSASFVISETHDITPRNSMLIINPLKFFLFYNLSYFHKINDQVVVGGGFQIPTVSGIDGFGANAEIRIYPNGKNLKGFYVAPNVSFNHISSNEGTTTPFSIGALVGWQWFPGDQFAIGFGIGIDYYIGSVEENNGELERYSGTVPAIRFDIGYAW